MNQQAYPLHWPNGWPRTVIRETPRFKTTLSLALANLQKQLDLMGGTNVLLSSNYTLGQANPKDPGVCAYFELEKQQLAIPCDRWLRIEANVQAIALTVEAMRGMERWGAKHMIKAMFSGFKLLQAPSRPWHEVLQVHPDAAATTIKEEYRKMAQLHHPDKGGNHDKMAEITNAYNQAREAGKVI